MPHDGRAGDGRRIDRVSRKDLLFLRGRLPGQFCSDAGEVAAPMAAMPIPPKAAVAAGEKGEQVTIPVRGMSCSSCVIKIENRLRSLPGVIEAAVNFGTEKATVHYIPSVHSLDDLKKAIRDVGYEPLDGAGEGELADFEREAREQEIRRLKFKTIARVALSIPF